MPNKTRLSSQETISGGTEPKQTWQGIILGDVEEANSYLDRPTGSMHFGDVDFDVEHPAFTQGGETTWSEVCTCCCVHTPVGWGIVFGGSILIFFFLYFFLVGLELLKSGASVLGACGAGILFGEDINPITGLMIGILTAALLQSPGLTRTIAISLAFFGDTSTTPEQAIYIVMGGNIGASATNTIIAMGHLGNGDRLERAFAGATVHDMFNLLTAAVLLPLELVTGYLFRVSKHMVKNYESLDGARSEGFVTKFVSPLVRKVIISNNDVVRDVARGGSCDAYYPVNCTDPSNPTKKTCDVGLIACDKKTNECPAFFKAEATIRKNDQISGLFALIIGLVVLFVSFFGLVSVLQRMLLGVSTRVLHKATNINGYLLIIIGALITLIVRSSTMTTSILTPLVGMGVLRLEQMLPLTLGANLGAIVITLIISRILGSAEFVQIYYVDFLFNLTGIVIWYPIPSLRNIPLHAARQLGKVTALNFWLGRGFPILYIVMFYFIIPLVVTKIFANASNGLVSFVSFLPIIVGCLMICYWSIRKFVINKDDDDDDINNNDDRHDKE